MSYQAFFVLCIALVVLFTILSDYRLHALIFGCVGFLVGLVFEVRGVANDEWSYADVDSLLSSN